MRGRSASTFLAVLSVAAFIYYTIELELLYGVNTWLAVSAGTLFLAVLATLMFFTLSFTFNVMRIVTGWFILIGGGVIALIGLGVLSTIIRST